MEKYTAELTVFDERNGEQVGTFKAELEDGALTSESIEALEDFVCQATSKYQEEVHGL